jgi:predicted ATPase
MSKKKSKIKKIVTNSSFSKIILENFKGYGKNTTVELSPGINLIYGKNSAGKSSIIQSLRLMRQSLLLKNSNTPLIPLPPTDLSLDGIIQFPEGIEGLVYAKDKSREVRLGLEIKRDNTNTKKTLLNTVIHGFKVQKSKDDNFADLTSLVLKRDSLENNEIKNETDIKINFDKKNWFNKEDKFGKFLEDMSEFSGPFNNSDVGWVFDETTDTILDKDIFYENGKIEKLKIVGVEQLFDEIIKDKEKNKKKIDIYISGFFKKKSSKKNKVPISQEIENDRNVIDIKRIKEMYDFINSPDFFIKEKFVNYFTKDIERNSKLVRFKDQLFDTVAYEKFIIKNKKKKMSFFIKPSGYLINILSTGLHDRPSFKPYLEFNDFYENYLNLVRSHLSSIVVIPGLRQLPERYHKRGLQSSFVGQSGENIGELVHNPEAQKRVNKWFKILDIPYEIRSVEEKNYFYLQMKPIGANYWISYRDVGLGYSLSLSFILTCLLESNKTILVEEPEVHLHPKLQGDIMDLLLYSSIKRKNQFIVETHSENMLLRAQKCIRRGHTKLNPEKSKLEVNKNDLGINNVYRENNTSSVQKIEIDEKGDFRTHWRDGFFSEKLDELF